MEYSETGAAGTVAGLSNECGCCREPEREGGAGGYRDGAVEMGRDERKMKSGTDGSLRTAERQALYTSSCDSPLEWTDMSSHPRPSTT